MNTASHGRCPVRRSVAATSAVGMAKLKRPVGKSPRATLMARLEWILYGDDAHGSGQMKENKLGSLYRAAPFRSPGRR
jgi:hypothetical protein